MGGRYKAYREYKDSGVEWLGLVPAHWKIVRLKELARVVSGYPFDSKLFDVSAGMPLVRIRDISSSKTEVGFVGDVPVEALIADGDILIGMDGDFNVAKWNGGQAALNQRVACVRACSATTQVFIFYVLPFCMQVINDLTYFTTVKHLSSADIHKARFALPPEDELGPMIKFLKLEVHRVDVLIRRQQDLIRLLKEKRQAVISHSVTKGLNPNAKMRDSGVEWLGAVPEHWEVMRIGLLFAESSARATMAAELKYPIFSVSIHHGISDKELNEGELDRKVSRSEDRSLYKVVRNNYLAYNMMRAWQGGLGCSKLSGLVSPAYVVCMPKTPKNSSYFELVLRTENAIVEMKKYSRGITDFRLRLYWDDFKNICVPVPDNDELDRILLHIENVNSTYDNLIVVSESQIELLQERRTALISAAVTGKIDVRDWVAPEGSPDNKEVAA